MTANDISTPDSDRQILAKALRRLFELWNLDEEQSAGMLGLDVRDPALDALRKGGDLPDRPDLIARTRVLLSIHRNLQMLLPTNPHVALKWMHAPNPALHGATPVDMVRSEGDAGASKLASLLKRQFARGGS